MASGGTAEISSCSVCLEEFTDPRILECFHTFCSSCLSSIIQRHHTKSVFPCPICRKLITMPAKVIRGFQKYFYIQNHSRSISEESPFLSQTCTACTGTQKIPCQCLDCNAFMCSACGQEHLRGRGVGHNVLSTDGHKVHGHQRCLVHLKQSLTRYCMTCKCLVCAFCSLGQHLGHEIGNISVIAQRERAKIAEVSSNIEEYASSLQSALVPLQDHYKELKKDLSEIKTKAAKRRDQLKEEIDESYSSFCENLKEIQTKKKQDFLEFANKMKRRQDLINELQGLLKSANSLKDIDVLKFGRPIYDRFLRVVKNREHVTLCKYAFEQNSTSFNSSDVIGRLTKIESQDHRIQCCAKILFAPLFEVKLVSSFKLSFSSGQIQGLVALPGGLCCIYFDHNKLLIINRDGVQRHSLELPGTPWKVNVCPDGSLFVLSLNCTIWHVEKTYTKISKSVEFDQRPYDICCTNSYVYILFSQVTSFIHMRRRSFVRKFDYSLKDLSPNKTKPEQKVFGTVRGFHEKSNGDLLLLEHSNDGCSEEVVVLCPEGLNEKSRCTLVGSSDKTFQTSSSCADVYGNILFADTKRNCIFSLGGEDPKLEMIIDSNKLDLDNLRFISVDEYDFLWICNSKKNATMKIFTYIK